MFSFSHLENLELLQKNAFRSIYKYYLGINCITPALVHGFLKFKQFKSQSLTIKYLSQSSTISLFSDIKLIYGNS